MHNQQLLCALSHFSVLSTIPEPCERSVPHEDLVYCKLGWTARCYSRKWESFWICADKNKKSNFDPGNSTLIKRFLTKGLLSSFFLKLIYRIHLLVLTVGSFRKKASPVDLWDNCELCPVDDRKTVILVTCRLWGYNSSLDVLQPLEDVVKDLRSFILISGQISDEPRSSRCPVDLEMKLILKTSIRVIDLVCCVRVAVLFLEHWKRRQISLSFSWDLTGIEEDEVYTAHVQTHTYTLKKTE